MGRHKKNKQSSNQDHRSSNNIGLFSFLDMALNALTSIFKTEKNSNSYNLTSNICT
jgi:hypothetical protein